jgi:homocysteine S-methyltransferase
MSVADPLRPFLDHQGVVVLDGGLATALEARGHVLHGALWSARVLRDDPATIRSVHEEFLQAGADCLVTASYQATLPGLMQQGMTATQAEAILQLSVTLAQEARQTFLASSSARGRLRPVVAASIGPYAAFLADASEYRGYDRPDAGTLRAFHEPRWRLMARGSSDLLACETIPSAVEARVILELIRETPDVAAWCSVSCRDEQRLRDGTSLAQVFADCDAIPNLVAVGVNCTAPRHIDGCLATLRGVTRKPLFVYPNSGEIYDPARGRWMQGPDDIDWGEAAVRWQGAGASGIGGCCRVGPDAIRLMRRRLLPGAP